MKILLGFCLIYFGILNLADTKCIPSVTRASGSYFAKQNITQICSGDLILSETFDTLDESLWNHELRIDGCSHNEFEEYLNDRSVSFADDGKLHILPKVVGDVPLKDGYFNPVQSARMTTSGRFSFRYGRLETRARVPAGDWLWPAIWMDPQTSKYGTWPISGEIDILEGRSNKNLVDAGKNIGAQLLSSTLHWGMNRTENRYKKTHYEARRSEGFDSDYHIFTMEWTPDFIAFGVDGGEIGRVTPPAGGFYELGQLKGKNPWENGTKMAPFDENFYFIVNVAVGGTSGYFPDSAKNPGGKPWKNWSKQASRDFWVGNFQWRPTWNEATRQRALKVDYIKVWAL